MSGTTFAPAAPAPSQMTDRANQSFGPAAPAQQTQGVSDQSVTAASKTEDARIDSDGNNEKNTMRMEGHNPDAPDVVMTHEQDTGKVTIYVTDKHTGEELYSIPPKQTKSPYAISPETEHKVATAA